MKSNIDMKTELQIENELSELPFADLHAMEFQLGKKEFWSKITTEDPKREYKLYISKYRELVQNEINERFGLDDNT